MLTWTRAWRASTHERSMSVLVACYCPLSFSLQLVLFCYWSSPGLSVCLLFQISKAFDATGIGECLDHVYQKHPHLVPGSVERPPSGVRVGRHTADRIFRRKARSPSVSIPCLQHMAASSRGTKHKMLQRASSQRFPQLPRVSPAEGNLHFITSGLELAN